MMNQMEDLGAYNNSLQSYRRRLIGDVVRENPQAAISSALKAAPGQQATMDISNTIRAWVGADSREAANWYQQHSATLTPAQRDSAASGFFTVAMEDESHDTARQWAEQIADPKLRNASLDFLDKSLRKKAAEEAAANPE